VVSALGYCFKVPSSNHAGFCTDLFIEMAKINEEKARVGPFSFSLKP